MWYSIFIYSFEIRFIEAVLHAVIYTFSFSPSRAPFWPEYCGYTICNILRFMVSTGCHPYAFRKANWSRNIVGKIFHKWIFYAFQDSSMLFSSSGIWDVWEYGMFGKLPITSLESHDGGLRFIQHRVSQAMWHFICQCIYIYILNISMRESKFHKTPHTSHR